MKQCTKCGTVLKEGYQFCTHCGTRQDAGETQEQKNVCLRCGNVMQEEERFCSVCGYCMEESSDNAAAGQQKTHAYHSYRTEQKPKSRLIAGLLGVLVGSFGIHRLYLGDKTIALVQLVVTIITCGVGGLWGVIEGLLLLYGKINKDAYGNPLEEF